MKPLPALATLGAILASASFAADVGGAVQDPIQIPAPPIIIIKKPVPAPKIEFALINTQKIDYLQTEFSGFPTGMGARIDSVSLRSIDSVHGDLRANLEVHWRWAVSGRDTIYSAARRMQFIQPLDVPYVSSQPHATRAVLTVDTIWTCQNGQCVIAPPPLSVRNYESRLLMCAVACLARDSSEIVTTIHDRILATGLALVLRPSQASSPIAPFGWTSTTGQEEYWSLCAKLPGNLGNWVARDLARFDVTPVAYTSASKSFLPQMLDYPEGPAQYAYNRSASPNLKILETQDVRVVNDTLVKFGKSLYLTGNTRVLCGRALDDTVAAKSSWLVVPDSAPAEFVERALSPAMCGVRSSAWRMSGDTVWLGDTKWPILLRTLLGTSALRGSDRISGEGSAPMLSGSRLELPWSASVVVRDLSGRRFAKFAELSAGTHSLDLAGQHGAFVVEVRSLDGKYARSFKGNAIGR